MGGIRGVNEWIFRIVNVGSQGDYWPDGLNHSLVGVMWALGQRTETMRRMNL